MQIVIIVITTILVFCTIYPPQVLLPFFAERYSITQSQAALLTSAALLPLSLAPLSYGYILESISSLKLLRRSILALAVTQLGFVLTELWSDSFTLLVVLRFGQGLILPAAMTSLMTYVSGVSSGRQVQRSLSIYIAASIVGGYAGRFLTGLSAEYVGWRIFFIALMIALLLNFFMLPLLKQEARIKSSRPKPKVILDTFYSGDYAKIYLIIFCTFFVFAGFLNFLPFRLVELWEEPSQSAIGVMYSGYLVGVVISLISARLITLFRGSINTIIIGLTCYALVLLAMTTSNTWLLFGALLIFCGAMFLIHAVAVGLVNRLGSQNKGIVNGLYVAFYYSGGVLGSYLPGLIYERFGWLIFVYSLLFVVGCSLVLAVFYKLKPKERLATGSMTGP